MFVSMWNSAFGQAISVSWNWRAFFASASFVKNIGNVSLRKLQPLNEAGEGLRIFSSPEQDLIDLAQRGFRISDLLGDLFACPLAASGSAFF